MLVNKIIHLVERNIRGAWVIYGALGVRQYYYMSRAEAVSSYKQEYQNTICVNRGV